MKSRFGVLSDDRLEGLAGAAAYGRGAAYHAEKRVEFLSLDAADAVARVRGSETYRVTLRCGERGPAGSCDCPAFDDTDFCKHMVAVALAARERAQAGAPVDRLARAGAFLRGQGLEAAVARLLALAERDHAVLDAIELDAAVAGEDDTALLRRYGAVIDKAVEPDDGWIDYGAARDYVAGLERVLDRLEALAEQGRAAVALALAERFLERIEDAANSVDDSNGSVAGAACRAAEIHLAACRRVRPDPLALAQWLFAQETGSDTDVFFGAASTYAEPLGAPGTAEYRRLAAAAWAASTPKDVRGRFALKSILDGFAKDDGDLDARIALRAADLSTPYAYLEIARLCLDEGREAEARGWACDGVWAFEDKPDSRLVRIAAKLERKAGRETEAAAMLWKAFERTPDLDLVADLKSLVPDGSALVAQAAAVLRAKGEHWRLLDLQMAEGLFDDALDTANRHAFAAGKLEALADAVRASHPDRAMALYERLAEGCIQAGGASAYDAAVDLIRRRGLACRDPAAQAAYVDDVSKRHKAKRTLIPRLQALAASSRSSGVRSRSTSSGAGARRST